MASSHFGSWPTIITCLLQDSSPTSVNITWSFPRQNVLIKCNWKENLLSYRWVIVGFLFIHKPWYHCIASYLLASIATLGLVVALSLLALVICLWSIDIPFNMIEATFSQPNLLDHSIIQSAQQFFLAQHHYHDQHHLSNRYIWLHELEPSNSSTTLPS